MSGTTIRRIAAALGLVALLALGPLRGVAWAEQPSDPNDCGASCTGGDPGGTDVLGEAVTNTTVPLGPLAKTGGDSSPSLLAGASITVGALALRRVARRS